MPWHTHTHTHTGTDSARAHEGKGEKRRETELAARRPARTPGTAGDPPALRASAEGGTRAGGGSGGAALGRCQEERLIPLPDTETSALGAARPAEGTREMR